MYPVPYSLFLASCSMGSPLFLILFLDLMFPSVVAVLLSLHWGSFWDSVVPLLSSSIELSDSLYGYVHLWIGQVHSWLACLIIHPSMTLVKLTMIGHCCDHLVGELNCLASTHLLIAQPRLCSSTLFQWL